MIGCPWAGLGGKPLAAISSSDAGRGPAPCREPTSTEETIRASTTTMPAVTEGWHWAASQPRCCTEFTLLRCVKTRNWPSRKE